MNDIPAPHELPAVGVLMVDDRPENLYALEVILEPLGQRLVRAQSGRDALRAASEEQFAVILMDVCMPDLDGFCTPEAIEEFRIYEDLKDRERLAALRQERALSDAH